MTVASGARADVIDWSRRLDRLRRQRLVVPGSAVPAPSPRDRAGGAASRARASRLADVLGGTLEDSPDGAVVHVHAPAEVSASAELAAPLERLGSLPWQIDTSSPLVCLDTETTGLGTAAGTVAFLVGLGRWDGRRFAIEQLLLPDHPDEPAFLAALEAVIPEGTWLVTYNGRGFDWPLLSTRYRLHRGSPPVLGGHLDLLPIARQLWRHRLDDARLPTVEAGVLGIRRGDDLPGPLIPARYFEYLRTGRPEPLRAVLRHNAQDVVSLGLLLAHLAGRLADPDARCREHPGDVAALGRAYARRRRFDEALACCDAALETAGRCSRGERTYGGWSPGREGARDGPRATAGEWPYAGVERDRIAAERARVLRLAGHRETARGAWLELATGGGRLAAHAWVQVAKHDEHVRRDPPAALAAAERAARLAERDRYLGQAAFGVERDLARRLVRLRKKTARGRGPGAVSDPGRSSIRPVRPLVPASTPRQAGLA
jgi:uncharacterized protein